MLDGQRKMELVCSHNLLRISLKLAASVGSLEDSYATACISAITIECTIFVPLVQQNFIEKTW